MGAPTMYRYDDPGFPALSARENQFYEMLRACLVDGYTNKAAAGWTVVYDEWDTLGWASFTNASQSAVIGIVKCPGYQPWLFIADAMVDAVTPVNGRSGYAEISAGFSPAYNNGAYQRPAVYTYDHPYFCVVANENAAVFYMATSYSNFRRYGASYNYLDGGFLAIGAFRDVRGLGTTSDPDPGNFLIFGGYRNSSYNHNAIGTGATGSSMGTALRGSDNSPISGTAHGFSVPLIVSLSETYSPNMSADQIASLALQECDYYVSVNTSSNWVRYGVQRAILPMLRTSPLINGGGTDSNEAVLSYLGVTPGDDVVQIAGKDHILIRASLSCSVFLSLDVEDWT